MTLKTEDYRLIETADGNAWYAHAGTRPDSPMFAVVEPGPGHYDWDGENHAQTYTLSEVESDPDLFPAEIAEIASTH